MSKKKEIPFYESEMVETHCHLDYLKEVNPQEAIELAAEKNVSKLITISVDPSNLDTVMNIARQFPQVYCSQGVHPHNAKDWNEEVEKKIKLNIKEKKVVAIGEIGLDYYYNNSEPDIQKQVFRKQLEMASELKLPVIIHSRDAEDDTIEILKEFPQTKGEIHSFTSSLNLAQFALDQGLSLGFNGIITFKNAQSVRDAVSLAPLDRILLETDSPFLAPTPFRGKENAPHYLPLVAQKVAEIKSISVEEVIGQTTRNANTLFSL